MKECSETLYWLDILNDNGSFDSDKTRSILVECPPSNVFAAYNNVPAGVKKVMWTNPYTGHFGTTKDITGEARLKEFFRTKK